MPLAPSQIKAMKAARLDAKPGDPLFIENHAKA
jgi:hypothetical protein